MEMWHFEILQAKDGRRVRHGHQGLSSLRCTSDFHFDRLKPAGIRHSCDFQLNTRLDDP